jgi:VanZ family protein
VLVNAKFIRGFLWSIAGLVAVVVVAVSVMPQPPAPLLDDDKLSHALAYAVLVQSVLLAAVWAPGLGDGRWPRGAVLIVCAAIAVGAFIEILQGAYFERTPDRVDALANAVGAAAGGLTWRGLRGLTES